MSENLRRSPCAAGEKQPDTATCAIDLKFDVLMVREVPALVHTRYHDAWIDNPVVAKLEDAVAEERCE